jgi:hypothetical protein
LAGALNMRHNESGIRRHRPKRHAALEEPSPSNSQEFSWLL